VFEYACLRTCVRHDGILYVAFDLLCGSTNSCSVRGVSICGASEIYAHVYELMFGAMNFYMWCVFECVCICLRTHVLCEGFLYWVHVCVHVCTCVCGLMFRDSCSPRGFSICDACVCLCVRVSTNSCSVRGDVGQAQCE
jgi:hypothetical protein